MNLTIEINSLEALDQLVEEIISWKADIQDQMAIALSDIVLQNFGDSGIDRPQEWEPLGPGYALKHHDGDRTPREILTGELRSSIDVELGDPDKARVFTDCEYAAFQQWGGVWGGHAIPARPFFPLVGDQDTATLTPYAEQEVRNAAIRVLEDKIAALSTSATSA